MTPITLPKDQRLLLLTKPFVDSDKVAITEVTVVGEDRIHWICERKPGSRHYFAKAIVHDFEVLS